MAASADVVNKVLIEIFESVPEYDDYGDPDAIRAGEDTYRVALARLTKNWGDQLLELAEEPPTPLTGHDVHTIDALVENIAAIITQLNDLDRARTLGRTGVRRRALSEAELILAGRSGELLQSLRAQMSKLAQEQAFEQAARVRDKIRSIQRTIERQDIETPGSLPLSKSARECLLRIGMAGL